MHIKGFDSRWFTGIEVRDIWLSAGIDPNRPQAFSAQAIRGLVSDGRFLSRELDLLAGTYGASKAEADKLLMKTSRRRTPSRRNPYVDVLIPPAD